MFLVRKIARAKWDATRNVTRGLAEGEISADAVTVDLRTREDTLSFWQCGAGANEEIEDAALAIAVASERLDRLDIVWLADNELRTDGQSLKDTEGQTPIADLVDRHVDICRLDYSRLGKVAWRVVAAIEDERYRRLTKARVRQLLVTAVEKGRITPEKLADDLRREIENDGKRRSTGAG